jgi:hypothetical protein
MTTSWNLGWWNSTARTHEYRFCYVLCSWGAPPACASPSPCSPACRTSRRTRARRWGKPSPCLPYRHSYKYTSIGFVWFCFYACIKPSVDRPKNNVFQGFWFYSWIFFSWIERRAMRLHMERVKAEWDNWVNTELCKLQIFVGRILNALKKTI